MADKRLCGMCRIFMDIDGICPYCKCYCCAFCDDPLERSDTDDRDLYCQRCDRYFLLRLVYICCGEYRVVGWGHEC